MPRFCLAATALSLTLLAGCAADSIAPSCPDAIDAVRACYGERAAQELAASCTEDQAAAVAGRTCTDSKFDDREDSDFLCEVLGICNGPVEFDDEVDNFKYGSIGTDMNGIPYWVFKVLPQICPDRMPARADGSRWATYEGFGYFTEPGHDLPIGISRRWTFGLERVSFNCASCHVGSARTPEGGDRKLVLGAPGPLDVGAYQRFVVGCILDPRFQVDEVLDAIENVTDLGFKEKLVYAAAIKLAPKLLGDRGELFDEFFAGRPEWGPGRSDPPNAVRALLFGEISPLIGTIDTPSIWNQAVRAGKPLHWDGSTLSALERNIGVVLGAGVDPDDIPLDRLERVNDWLTALPPPVYPGTIDRALADAGEVVFARECAGCHALGGARVFEVIPVAEIGTHPGRHDSIDAAWVEKLKQFRGDDWSFETTRATAGYVAAPLDGIWMRAPYLHNGSVPSLRDLLAPPAERPATFFRGGDLYDTDAVGFAAGAAASGAKVLFLFDTAVPGNSSVGHDYGTALPAGEQDALLEYLKTL